MSGHLSTFKFLLLLLLSCMISLYILDINPISDVWFTNIFFFFVGCLFVFDDHVLFYVECFQFDIVLFVFVFVSLAIGVKNIPEAKVKELSTPMFLLCNLWFQVLHSSL